MWVQSPSQMVMLVLGGGLHLRRWFFYNLLAAGNLQCNTAVWEAHIVGFCCRFQATNRLLERTELHAVTVVNPILGPLFNC
jgi:hypothetical protein